jgi:hypothetical protein
MPAHIEADMLEIENQNSDVITECQKRKGIGMPLSWAESFWVWANWALIFALVLGVVATFLIVISSKVKEDALKRQLADASAKIEDATARAAEANARAAEANRMAEEERLARVRIEQRLAPRSLSGKQQQNIADKIKNSHISHSNSFLTKTTKK